MKKIKIPELELSKMLKKEKKNYGGMNLEDFKEAVLYSEAYAEYRGSDHREIMQDIESQPTRTLSNGIIDLFIHNMYDKDKVMKKMKRYAEKEIKKYEGYEDDIPYILNEILSTPDYYDIESYITELISKSMDLAEKYGIDWGKIVEKLCE